MEITQQDVEEVADAISSRFDRDIVRLVTMGLSVDEDFGDCIREGGQRSRDRSPAVALTKVAPDPSRQYTAQNGNREIETKGKNNVTLP